MSFRRLQVFVAIIESGSFTGAARRLGIAQPSVSAHVNALEKEIAVKLFERASGRQAVLTEAGRGFLGYARDAIERTVKLEEDMRARRGSKTASVAFCCQRSLAHTVFRGPLSHFALKRRDIRLSLRICFQEEVMAAVRMGAADLGCLISDEEPSGIPSLLLGRQSFVIFAALDHPLAGRQKISPRELAQYDFVGPVASSQFGRIQRRMLSAIGIDRISIAAEGTEFSVVRDLTEAGLGIGCSLRASIEPDFLAGRIALLDIDAPPLRLDVRLVFNSQRRFIQPVKDFTQFLRQSLPQD